MDDIDGQDDPYIARRMNEEVEAWGAPEYRTIHGSWKLLKTRKDGEEEPYKIYKHKELPETGHKKPPVIRQAVSFLSEENHFTSRIRLVLVLPTRPIWSPR